MYKFIVDDFSRESGGSTGTRREPDDREIIVPICSHCGRVRDNLGVWRVLTDYADERGGLKFSHGICPTCMKVHYPEIS